MVKLIQPRARLTETQPGAAYDASFTVFDSVLHVAAGVTATLQLDHDFVTTIDARYSQGVRNILAFAQVSFIVSEDVIVAAASNFRSWVAHSLKITNGGVPSTVQIGGAQSINLDREGQAGGLGGPNDQFRGWIGGELDLVDGNDYIITGVRADFSFLSSLEDMNIADARMTFARLATGLNTLVNI